MKRDPGQADKGVEEEGCPRGRDNSPSAQAGVNKVAPNFENPYHDTDSKACRHNHAGDNDERNSGGTGTLEG